MMDYIINYHYHPRVRDHYRRPVQKSPITRLRHVGLAVPNFAQALEFYRGVWGLQSVVETPDIAFLGSPADPEHYILRVRRAEDKCLELISFAVDSPQQCDDLAARLGSADIPLVVEPRTLDTPGGGYGFRFFDPDGRLVEVSADVAGRAFRPLAPREAIPQRLSHVVINSPNILSTKHFYEHHLGVHVPGGGVSRGGVSVLM